MKENKWHKLAILHNAQSVYTRELDADSKANPCSGAGSPADHGARKGYRRIAMPWAQGRPLLAYHAAGLETGDKLVSASTVRGVSALRRLSLLQIFPG